MVKRYIDVVLCLSVIPFVLPVVFIVFVVTAFVFHGKPLFVQKRIGKNCREFNLYKFRTMSEEIDHNGDLLPDSARMNGYGRLLRGTSLDELPQILNILKGDISIVGPRPLLPEYLEFYTERQARRHEVLPGLTGWAQINGRNSTTWEERLEDDVWYVENRSFALDMKIIAKTVSVVISRKGIRNDGHATMQKFTGTKK